MRRLGLVVLWPVISHASTAPGVLDFEPNLGQTHSSVRYLARVGSAMVFIRDHGIVLHHSSLSKPASTIDIEFVGAARNVNWQPLDPGPGRTTYLIGRNPAGWIHDIPHFHRLLGKNLYPGVDLVVHGSGDGKLEYDFVLAPGADWKRIQLQFKNSSSEILPNGDLLVRTASGAVLQKKPVLYQTDRDGSLRPIDGNTGWFEVAVSLLRQSLTTIRSRS